MLCFVDVLLELIYGFSHVHMITHKDQTFDNILLAF